MEIAVEGQATARSEESAVGAPEPVLGRIPALDGIRAIGITLVLFFHGGFSWAGGGFFGVDVFFVLSGFLITGLLLSEFRQNSGIGLKRFWGHRIRRLFPALIAVLCGVCVYAEFFASSDTLGQIRSDAIATLLYVNNWHQASGGQGYFAALNTPRPLLHTWSLSIEEQFYLVWPLIVLVILRWTRSLKFLLGLTVAGALASAIAMSVLYHGGAGESRVYFGTDTRVQALLIGAALAIVLANPLPRHRRLPAKPTTSLVRPVVLSPQFRVMLIAIGGIGLVGIAIMAIRTSSSSAWIYHGGFALISLATAAVIASVALIPTSPWARFLSLRPIRYVGAISYGLYLWHWPIFVFMTGDRTGLTGWSLFVVRVAASVAAAAISLRYLEMPIRRGALRGWRAWTVGPVAIGGTVVILAVATAGGTAAVDAAPTLVASNTKMAKVAAWQAGAMLKALRSADPGTSAGVPYVPPGTTGRIRALLLGDSEASFLGFGVAPLSPEYGISYAGDGVFGCGMFTYETAFHGTLVPGTGGLRGGQKLVHCSTQLVRWKADVDAFHPDVVLLADGEYEVRDQLVNGKWTNILDPTFDAMETQALTRATNVLHSTGAVVVLLTAPYYNQPEQADGQPWPEDNPARVDRYNSILRKVAAASGGSAVVIDIGARLDPGGHYVGKLHGVYIRYADGIHVTPPGAKLVSPWLLKQVVALGTSNRHNTASAH